MKTEKKKAVACMKSFVVGGVITLILSIVSYNYQQSLLEIERLKGFLDEVKELEEIWNRVVPVYNKDEYELEDGFIPIVVYVHRRPHYFSKVMDALSKVTDIQKTMIIVSHDALHPQMLNISASARFAQIKQLLHPSSPAHDGDPLSLKNHWWWLQSYIWTTMFPNREEDICFIEEDHLVSPDFYQTLKILSSMKRKGIVDNCTTVALGSWNMDFNQSESKFVTYEGFLNTGYAFNRTVWNKLAQYRDIWDVADPDNDWDTALVEGLMRPGLIGFHQITPMLSRIKNIGLEGLHATQIVAKKAVNEEYPVSKNPSPDWTNLELVSQPHDGSPIQLKERGVPTPVPVCRGSDCVLPHTWKQISKQ